ncbi:MAG: TolC family protein [Candidatus Zixiibacteriota bacterium]
MKIKISLLLLLIPVIASMASAKEITINDAVGLARAHSYKLKASRAQAQAYQQNLKAAVSERMPTLSLDALASYKNEVAQLEIAIPGVYTLTRDFGFKETYLTDLRLTMPLFTGGRISGGIGLAQATRDYYEALSRASEDELILAARIEYLTLYRGDLLVDAAEARLKRAKVIRDDTQSLYDAGAADSVNILDASLALANAGLQLKQAQTYRRQSELRLLVLLGLEPTEHLDLIDVLSDPPESTQGFSGVSTEKPELLAASSSVEMSSSLYSLNRADYFPTLSAFAGYSWGKPNLDYFHDEFNDYFIVGARLNWSFNLGGKSQRKVSMSRHQLEAARNQYEQTREQLDQQARLVLENLKLALEEYRTAAENHRIASDNYRLVTDQHRQGVLAANRLIEIETSLSEAEASLASARVAYYMVLSQYYYATGSKKLEEGI